VSVHASRSCAARARSDTAAPRRALAPRRPDRRPAACNTIAGQARPGDPPFVQVRGERAPQRRASRRERRRRRLPDGLAETRRHREGVEDRLPPTSTPSPCLRDGAARRRLLPSRRPRWRGESACSAPCPGRGARAQSAPLADPKPDLSERGIPWALARPSHQVVARTSWNAGATGNERRCGSRVNVAHRPERSGCARSRSGAVNAPLNESRSGSGTGDRVPWALWSGDRGEKGGLAACRDSRSRGHDPLATGC
jgi:hypothetical protein